MSNNRKSSRRHKRKQFKRKTALENGVVQLHHFPPCGPERKTMQGTWADFLVHFSPWVTDTKVELTSSIDKFS